MGLLVLSLVLLLTIALGIALAKGVLNLILHLLTEQRVPAVDAFRVAVFVGALIVFWSLAPAIAESPAASGLNAFMR
ncbi:MAG TPA: hypothetical protein VFO58_03350 [Vicinamibacterales bacterium]|nr:hypothetical protein [Vicinamibacterales bacterium]